MWAVVKLGVKKERRKDVQSADLQENSQNVSLHQKLLILHHYQLEMMLRMKASTTYLGLCKKTQILLRF